MLSALPAELVLRREAHPLPPLTPAVTAQLVNRQYWHISTVVMSRLETVCEERVDGSD